MDPTRHALTAKYLTEVAQALNDLRDLGRPVVIRHGAIMTDCGFILPDDEGGWMVRMKTFDPHMQPVGDPDDD